MNIKTIVFTFLLTTFSSKGFIFPFMQAWTQMNKQNCEEAYNGIKQLFNPQQTTQSESEKQMTLADIGGTIPVEIQEAIAFINNSEKYDALGARMPRNILLYGPAGTGKTSLARAIAGEVNAAFFSASGSEFIEMYVGVGPARVRKLFTDAQAALASGQYQKAIIFIDEIDAIGGKRTQESNSEYRNTLNELLNQLDGFNKNTNIFVIAATNHIQALDPALKRPGRFDRLIKIDLPNREDRESILRLYLNKTRHEVTDECIGIIAEKTVRFNAAELELLVNEAVIMAVRCNAPCVADEHVKSSLQQSLARNKVG